MGRQKVDHTHTHVIFDSRLIKLMPVLELFHKEYKQSLLQFPHGHPSKTPHTIKLNQDLLVAKNHHKYRL